MRKKIIAGIIMFAMATTMSEAKILNDVKESDWYYSTVANLVSAGIIEGYPDGNFQPSKAVQVDQFVKMVLVGIGHNDIPSGNEYWASEYIQKAKELKILTEADFMTLNNGHDYTRVITRAEMALLINRAISNNESTIVNTKDDTEAYSTLIGDLDNIDSLKKGSVIEIYAKGILTGYPDGNFKPNRSLTRAEASTVILRLINIGERVKVTKPSGINPIFKDTTKYMNDYFDIVGNELRFKYTDGTLTNYRLKEDNIPGLNKKVYDTVVALLKDPVGNNSVGASYTGSVSKYDPPTAHVNLGGLSMFNGSYNFSYTFYEDGNNCLNPSTNWNEPTFATKSFMTLHLVSLYSYAVDPALVNRLQDEYAWKLKDSLNAIFGDTTGLKIYNYVMGKYNFIAVGLNKATKIRESKIIDNVRIDFANGVDWPYNKMYFHFSYVK